MLTRLKLALSVWSLAAACELAIVVVLIHSQSLASVGIVALAGAVCVHPVVLIGCLRRRRWAYGTFFLLAPLSLFWWPFGKPWLLRIGAWAFLVIGACIVLRLFAMALIRDRQSKAWICSCTRGPTFWLARRPTLELGLREKLIQILAAMLLGPALVGYANGWNRAAVFLCVAAAMTLVLVSLLLARRR
jgi:hypothetical protein